MTDLVSRVRRRLASDGTELGPDLDSEGFDVVVRDEVDVIADDAEFAALRRDVEAELTGAGILEPLLALPGVTDVLVNGPGSVWVDRGRGMERTPVSFADDAAVRGLAQRLACAAGRRLDDAMPYVDAALPDGTRLHAVLPPLTAATTLSLRVLARQRHDLAGLVRLGTMSDLVAELLDAIVGARLAFVVSGGAGCGKTTLLGALLGLAPPDERLVVIEDAAELVVEHPHLVRLVARTANVEGVGAVGLRDLVRLALRMRPDRLVVGEFRGAEMVELLVALNTGHEGGAATVHANSARDVPARFAALGGLGGLPSAAVTPLVSSAIDAVVHLRRGRDGQRRVDEIGLFERRGDELTVKPVWSSRGGVGVAASALAARLAERAQVVPALLR
jgi:pilus assembly protein CpaF